jgi:hypothetical protein
MAISTYAELTATLSDWLNSSGYDGQASEFIALSEAHFNRELRVPEMEASASSVTSSATVALPSDFLAAREVYIDDDQDTVLIPMSPSHMRMTYAEDAAGEPEAYTITGTNLILAPAPSASVTVGIAYFQQIPALTASNTTNWLLTSHPDLYLRAARFHAYDYARDDEAADREIMRVNAIIDSINRAGHKQRVPATPLAMRPANFA